MRKAYIMLILGVWVAVLPYLGFPYALKGILTSISGLGFIFVSYMLYKQLKINESKKERTFENFSENNFGNEQELN